MQYYNIHVILNKYVSLRIHINAKNITISNIFWNACNSSNTISFINLKIKIKLLKCHIFIWHL